MAQSLTQQDVSSLSIENGRKMVADGGCKGLYLDVRPTGKSWRYRFTDAQGKAASVTIGDAELIPLEGARKKVEMVSVRNPSRRKGASENAMPYYAQFVECRYLPHAFSTKKAAAWEEIIYRCHLKPAFGELRLDQINRASIVQMIQEKRDKGYKPGSINRMLSILKVSIATAIEWEVGGLENNGARGVKLLKDPPRIDRFLSQAEASSLMDAIRKSESAMLRYIVPFLLFTGARKREALNARWQYVDLDKGQWTIPFTKAGKPRYVPLSSQAVFVLREAKAALCALGKPPSEWVFPNPMTGKPYSSIFHPWDKCRTSVGLKSFRMHDLRHSFASALVNRGMTLYDVKEALGHSNIATTQRYAHLSPERLRKAIAQAGDHYSSSTS